MTACSPTYDYFACLQTVNQTKHLLSQSIRKPREKKLRKAKQSYNNTNSKQKKSISWKVERLLSLIYSCGWPPLSKVLCLRVTSGSGLTFLLKVRCVCREFYDKLNEWRVIGSCLWSLVEQTYTWRLHQQVFLFVIIKKKYIPFFRGSAQ